MPESSALSFTLMLQSQELGDYVDRWQTVSLEASTGNGGPWPAPRRSHRPKHRTTVLKAQSSSAREPKLPLPWLIQLSVQKPRARIRPIGEIRRRSAYELGAVRVAKSRVLRRLRQELRDL